MQWTDSQRRAIDARSESMLVSAAAGSGKTAVLVEKALSLLREGRDVDRLLIVTFTRAAASEMRARIAAALERESVENDWMRRQLLRLPRACIATLHVFCSRVIREHFQVAGVDPSARVGEEARLNALLSRALEEALENAYLQATEGDADARALTEQYTDVQILEISRALYRFLMARAEPFAWLDAQLSAPDTQAFFSVLREECAQILQGAQALNRACLDLLQLSGAPDRYAPAALSDELLLQSLLARVQSGETPGKPAFERLSSKRAPEGEDQALTSRFRAARDDMKKQIGEALKLLPTDREADERDILWTLPALRALAALVRDAHARYAAYKDARNMLDYNDLEQLALRVLADDDARRAVAARFDVIFVDEYQDISGAQEAILSRAHLGNMLFMVGDVKQSIYRFRLADPTLFMRKLRAYSPEDGAPRYRLSLQQNFRSRANILLAVNHVFSHAMRADATEIAYDDEAALVPGRGGDPGAAVLLRVMLPGEDGEPGFLREAREAAKIIKALSGEYRFRDMAILLRNASGRAPRIAKVLQDEGIPVYSDADAEFFDLPEITDMLSILRVLENPMQDVPLLCALRSPAFSFTAEELSRVRLASPPKRSFYDALTGYPMADETPLSRKVARALATLSDWRFLSRNMPPESLLYRLLDETDIYARAGALPGGESRRANLRLLCERAQGESSLHDFLCDVDTARRNDDGKSAKTLSESENVVRVMTLHKSKGLEFPVVLLMELAREFRMPEGGELLQCDEDGLALKFVDAERRVTRQTVACKALQLKKARALRAEEARLLYVGMTRARERLILLASPKSAEKTAARWALPMSAYAAGSAESMLDWIGQSLQAHCVFGEDARFRTENGSVWDAGFCAPEAHEMEISGRAPRLPSAEGEIPAYISARMAGRHAAGKGFRKTSVTALVRGLQTAEEETAEDKRRAFRLDRPLPERPAYQLAGEGAALTAAERGTATHKALSQCDIHQEDIVSQISALRLRGMLSDAEADAAQPAWIARYFHSPLGERMRAAKTVRREWAFNYLAEDGLLLQGVVDCCFLEDGAWVLVDYKTDDAPADALRQRYARQLSWYAKALAGITGKPVRERYLYALRTGEAILLQNDY